MLPSRWLVEVAGFNPSLGLGGVQIPSARLSFPARMDKRGRRERRQCLGLHEGLEFKSNFVSLQFQAVLKSQCKLYLEINF